MVAIPYESTQDNTSMMSRSTGEDLAHTGVPLKSRHMSVPKTGFPAVPYQENQWLPFRASRIHILFFRLFWDHLILRIRVCDMMPRSYALLCKEKADIKEKRKILWSPVMKLLVPSIGSKTQT